MIGSTHKIKYKVGWLIDGVIHWPIDWFVDLRWFVGWLMGWFIDRLICWLIDGVIHSWVCWLDAHGLRLRGARAIRSDVGSKSWYASQLICMFLIRTIRFTRRFEGTSHQVPFFTRPGSPRRHGNSTFGAFYVELSGLKDRCTSATECKHFPRMSNFTRRFGGMHCVWSFVHDPTTLRDVCVLPQMIMHNYA